MIFPRAGGDGLHHIWERHTHRTLVHSLVFLFCAQRLIYFIRSTALFQGSDNCSTYVAHEPNKPEKVFFSFRFYLGKDKMRNTNQGARRRYSGLIGDEYGMEKLLVWSGQSGESKRRQTARLWGRIFKAENSKGCGFPTQQGTKGRLYGWRGEGRWQWHQVIQSQKAIEDSQLLCEERDVGVSYDLVPWATCRFVPQSHQWSEFSQ